MKSNKTRLPAYYRVLRSLLQSGRMRTSSAEIGELAGINPSSVRQDFSGYASGQTGYGYSTKQLFGAIGGEIGLNNIKTAIIVSDFDCPYLSKCLESRGISSKVLEKWTGEEKADLLLLVSDCEINDEMTASGGIKGVWNLTQKNIKLSVPTENLPLGDIILGLCLRINEKK